MATEKERQAARKNVKKAQAGRVREDHHEALEQDPQCAWPRGSQGCGP